MTKRKTEKRQKEGQKETERETERKTGGKTERNTRKSKESRVLCPLRATGVLIDGLFFIDFCM